MSNDIKPIYPDKSGNTHETRAKAKKANRLIDGAESLAEGLGVDISTPLKIKSNEVIEFARSVVAIYGMKDKAPHNEVPK